MLPKLSTLVKLSKPLLQSVFLRRVRVLVRSSKWIPCYDISPAHKLFIPLTHIVNKRHLRISLFKYNRDDWHPPENYVNHVGWVTTTLKLHVIHSLKTFPLFNGLHNIPNYLYHVMWPAGNFLFIKTHLCTNLNLKTLTVGLHQVLIIQVCLYQ